MGFVGVKRSELRLVEPAPPYTKIDRGDVLASEWPHLPSPSSALCREEWVLYFAYGANMLPEVMRRRRVVPTWSLPARANDTSIVIMFDHWGGYSNLGVRNEKPQSYPWYSGAVTGVIHRVTRAEFDRLDFAETGYYVSRVRVRLLSEFAPTAGAWDTATTSSHNNEQEKVEKPNANGGRRWSRESFEALTFRSMWDLRLEESVPPPHKYRQRLIDGARYHNLSASYVSWLESLPSLDPHIGLSALPEVYTKTAADDVTPLILVGVGVACFAVVLRLRSLLVIT